MQTWSRGGVGSDPAGIVFGADELKAKLLTRTSERVGGTALWGRTGEIGGSGHSRDPGY